MFCQGSVPGSCEPTSALFGTQDLHSKVGPEHESKVDEQDGDSAERKCILGTHMQRRHTDRTGERWRKQVAVDEEGRRGERVVDRDSEVTDKFCERVQTHPAGATYPDDTSIPIRVRVSCAQPVQFIERVLFIRMPSSLSLGCLLLSQGPCSICNKGTSLYAYHRPDKEHLLGRAKRGDLDGVQGCWVGPPSW